MDSNPTSISKVAAKLDFNDGGWDNNPSSSSEDRPRRGVGRGGGRGGARSSRGDYSDYSRDPMDNKPIDESVVNSLLVERTQMRKRGMFNEADGIRDELLNVHGVTVWDKDRVWTTAAAPQGGRGGGRGRGRDGGRGGGRGERRGRGSGRGRGRERVLNEHGHDYSKTGGPIDCQLPEREIHLLIRERMECKFDRNFDMADSIQRELLSYGVEIHDGYKEWRADGESWSSSNSFRAVSREPRGPKVYTQRGPGAGLTEEVIETINQMVAERAEAKVDKDYEKADAIFEELGSTYHVNVDDRAGEWALRNEEYQMSSYSSVTPDEEIQKLIGNKLADRITARKNRDFDLADQIRQELEDVYLLKIDDKNKEWRVSQPEGARWVDDNEGDEFAGMNFVSKVEFDNDEDEDEDIDEDLNDEEDEEGELLDDKPMADLSSLTVPELKARLKEVGLPVGGVKADLIERLSAVL